MRLHFFVVAQLILILMLVLYSTCISQTEMRFKIVGKGGEITSYSIGKKVLLPSTVFSTVFPFGKAYMLKSTSFRKTTNIHPSNINPAYSLPLELSKYAFSKNKRTAIAIHKPFYRTAVSFNFGEIHGLPSSRNIVPLLSEDAQTLVKTGTLFAFARVPSALMTPNKPIIKQPLSRASLPFERHFDPFAYALYVPPGLKFRDNYLPGKSMPIKFYLLSSYPETRLLYPPIRKSTMPLLMIGEKRGKRYFQEVFSFTCPNRVYADKWAVDLEYLRQFHMMPNYFPFLLKQAIPSSYPAIPFNPRKPFNAEMEENSYLHIEGGSKGQPYVMGNFRTPNVFAEFSSDPESSLLSFVFQSGMVNNVFSLVQNTSDGRYVHVHNSTNAFTGKANIGMMIDVLEAASFQTSSIGGTIGLEDPAWKAILTGSYNDPKGWQGKLVTSYQTQDFEYPVYFRGEIGLENTIPIGGIELKTNLKDLGIGFSFYKKSIKYTPRDILTSSSTLVYNDTFSVLLVSLGRVFKGISFSSSIGTKNYDTLHIFTYIPTYSSTVIHSLDVICGSAAAKFDVEPLEFSISINGENNSDNKYTDIHLKGTVLFNAGFGDISTSNDLAFERLYSSQQISLLTSISSGMKFGDIRVGLAINNLWYSQQLFSPTSFGGALTLDYDF